MGAKMGWEEVIMEGDSLTTAKKWQSHYPDKSLLGAYIRNIQQLKGSFRRINFKYTPWLAKGLAQSIAIETLKRNEPIYLVGSIPGYTEWTLDMDWAREANWEELQSSGEKGRGMIIEVNGELDCFLSEFWNSCRGNEYCCWDGWNELIWLGIRVGVVFSSFFSYVLCSQFGLEPCSLDFCSFWFLYF